MTLDRLFLETCEEIAKIAHLETVASYACPLLLLTLKPPVIRLKAPKLHFILLHQFRWFQISYLPQFLIKHPLKLLQRLFHFSFLKSFLKVAQLEP